ncbi:VOC family protein [Shewanella submarina]|uniref:VOC family protein n=1 Tax=Shewanella submarina TaxID=2016376 RepID=A0ABV7GC49_9GAMM|nr:VOC family protein [Shewanella submarina]MCL1036738.1 VOC family protein [Shewanella submarina]
MLQQAVLVWGEIPVADMDRAVKFYQQHLGLTFRHESMEGMEMALIEQEDQQGAGAALVKCDMMTPSMAGSLVYLHLGKPVSQAVARLEQGGIEVLLPPMPIKDGECGHIAIFKDCEGNKVGLWSMEA